jgi:hypothetical protein
MEAGKSRKVVAKAAREILRRAIVPDASDAVKRSQALDDWRVLYHAGRRPLVDPRFATGPRR